eukprot:scaffold8573_cov164-Amphora_coffeaeformis.AAC.3
MVVVASATTSKNPSRRRWGSCCRCVWKKPVVGVVGFIITVLWVLTAATFLVRSQATPTTTTAANVAASLTGSRITALAAAPQEQSRQHEKDDGASQVRGVYQIIQREGRRTEVVYATPPQGPRAVALLLHGCSHSALKFFSPQPYYCPTCIGLAEELQITRLLVQQQTLLVLAVTSQDRQRGCWSGADVAHVQDVLLHFNITSADITDTADTTATIHHVPILALGASSGGHFAAQLAVRGMAHAALVGVMSLRDDLVQQWRNHNPVPLVLAPMPRDKHTTAATTRNYQQMQANHQHHTDNSSNNNVWLDTTTCVPLPVTVSYLNNRVPHMTKSMAQQIVTALTQGRHLDATSGMLQRDPTRSDWRIVLRDACGNAGCLENLPLGPGISPLAKALHRAWAFHEYCSEIIPPTNFLPGIKFAMHGLRLSDYPGCVGGCRLIPSVRPKICLCLHGNTKLRCLFCLMYAFPHANTQYRDGATHQHVRQKKKKHSTRWY